MAPPSEPLLVHCIECDQEYMSTEIWFRNAATPDDPLDGIWCCPTKGCGGIGYGFGIYPADGSDGGLDGGWFDDDGNTCEPPWMSEE